MSVRSFRGDVIALTDKFMQSVTSLERGLATAALRNQVIAHNIANIDTPGYQAQEVPFEQVLDAEVSKRSFQPHRTDPRHYTWEPVTPQSGPVVRNANGVMRMDENTVDLEHEMNELAKNTLYYNALSTKITKQFSRLRLAISGGNS